MISILSMATDKLTSIEGIGPKTAVVLQNAGIRTFAQLASRSPDDLRAILQAAGKPFSISDPSTWPEQAGLAVAGRWEELKALQDELYVGRRVKQTTKYRILSLDGGTHGFSWLFCLREIEEDNPGFLSHTDMFVGSSFGGFCSLYLAYHMGSLEPGDSGVHIIRGCIAFMKELLSFQADEAAFQRLLGGMESMYDHERMERVLTHKDHLGESTMADLHRRVVITTYGTHRPGWGPVIYDSEYEEDQGVRCSELGLASAALPVLLPIRNGLANGSLGGSNGSLHGLTHVIGRHAEMTFDDVALMSLGGDPGTSALSNFPTPWDSKEAVPEKLSIDAILTPSPEKQQAMAMLGQKIEALWQDLDKSMEELGDPTTSHLGTPLSPPDEKPDPSAMNPQWGWRKWLTDKSSPLFFYSIIINNQALDVAEQTKMLLGDHTIRVAPMALLSSGQVLFMTFLSTTNASELILRVAELTAELWSDPETSEAYKFTPTIKETEEFIDNAWMPKPLDRPGDEERRSGWRRIPAGEMHPGQRLRCGQKLSSSDGRFSLVMQEDGNLVLYGPRGAKWASNTWRKPSYEVRMQEDGNLVVYTESGHPLWASDTWGKNGAVLVVQNDGNMVLYQHGSPIWHTNTAE